MTSQRPTTKSTRRAASEPEATPATITDTQSAPAPEAAGQSPLASGGAQEAERGGDTPRTGEGTDSLGGADTVAATGEGREASVSPETAQGAASGTGPDAASASSGDPAGTELSEPSDGGPLKAADEMLARPAAPAAPGHSTPGAADGGALQEQPIREEAAAAVRIKPEEAFAWRADYRLGKIWVVTIWGEKIEGRLS